MFTPAVSTSLLYPPSKPAPSSQEQTQHLKRKNRKSKSPEILPGKLKFWKIFPGEKKTFLCLTYMCKALTCLSKIVKSCRLCTHNVKTHTPHFNLHQKRKEILRELSGLFWVTCLESSSARDHCQINIFKTRIRHSQRHL